MFAGNISHNSWYFRSRSSSSGATLDYWINTGVVSEEQTQKITGNPENHWYESHVWTMHVIEILMKFVSPIGKINWQSKILRNELGLRCAYIITLVVYLVV